MKLKKIKKIVDRHVGFDISVKNRTRDVVDARKMYFGLCREFTSYGLKVLGDSIDRDHSTALYNIRSCKDLREMDKFFNETYISLKKKVQTSLNIKYNFEPITTPRAIHPGFLRYANKKSIRKVLDKRRYSTK
jgi:hypothetical protein